MEDNIYQPPSSGFDLTAPKQAPGSSGNYSFDRAFSLGWEGFTQNMGLGMGITLILLLLTILATISCFGIFFALPQLIASVSMVGLAMVRNTLTIETMFSGFQTYWSTLGAVFIRMLISIALAVAFQLPLWILLFGTGTIGDFQDLEALNEQTLSSSTLLFSLSLLQNLVYPVSFYLEARFIVSYPLIIEQNYNPIEAMKLSWQMTASNQWSLWLLYFLANVIAGGGVLLCCIGVFFTAPLAMAIQGGAISLLLDDDHQSQDETPVTFENNGPGTDNPYG